MMFDKLCVDLIKSGKFDEIKELTAQAAAIVKEIRG